MQLDKIKGTENAKTTFLFEIDQMQAKNYNVQNLGHLEYLPQT